MDGCEAEFRLLLGNLFHLGWLIDLWKWKTMGLFVGKMQFEVVVRMLTRNLDKTLS